MPSAEKKVSFVTFDGRTIVDTNALLRDPKVRATIERMKQIRSLAADDARTRASKKK